MELPEEARRRVETDEIAWLTTVTDRGSPAPNPVWFVPEGDVIVVFAKPDSVKVRNIAQRPLVCVHFNSTDDLGEDVVIVNGTAELDSAVAMSTQPGYLAKYEALITGPLETTVEEIEAAYSTRIRITPTRVRLTPVA